MACLSTANCLILGLNAGIARFDLIIREAGMAIWILSQGLQITAVMMLNAIAVVDYGLARWT
jgi:hypothetical protein